MSAFALRVCDEAGICHWFKLVWTSVILEASYKLLSVTVVAVVGEQQQHSAVVVVTLRGKELVSRNIRQLYPGVLEMGKT